MVVREGVRTTPAGEDRDLLLLRDLDELRRRPSRKDAPADEEGRARGGANELQGPLDGARFRGRCGGDDRLDSRAFDFLSQQVLPERQDDRTRPAGDGDAGGADRQLRQPVGGGRLDGPLGDLAEDGRQLGLLERFAVTPGRGHLAEDDDEWRRVLACRVDGDRRMAAADHPRCHREGGTPRQPGVGSGHVRRALFMTRRDEADRRVVVDRVQQTHEALAGYTEGVVDARRAEHVEDRSAAVDPGCVHCLVTPPGKPAASTSREACPGHIAYSSLPSHQGIHDWPDAHIPKNRPLSSQTLRTTITPPQMAAATVVARRLTCPPMTSWRDVSQTSGMIAKGS